VSEEREGWLPVYGYEGLYEVSNLGRVRSVERTVRYVDGRVRRYPSRVLRTATDSGGYQTVHLCNGRDKTARIHCLVAEAFIERTEDYELVRHLNGDPSDNRVQNLAWGTSSENARDTVRHGRNRQAVKTHCARGHEFDEANTGYRKGRGGRCRYCRACLREDGRRIYWAKKQRETTAA
jgi:hypothetical protein